jgi:hypothetical protein
VAVALSLKKNYNIYQHGKEKYNVIGEFQFK